MNLACLAAVLEPPVGISRSQVVFLAAKVAAIRMEFKKQRTAESSSSCKQVVRRCLGKCGVRPSSRLQLFTSQQASPAPSLPGTCAIGSVKSNLGHLLGAAGAVEAVFSILAVREGVAPPTLNLDEASRESVIDRVAHTAQERKIDCALSNSFGFGGTNASVIFRAA